MNVIDRLLIMCEDQGGNNRRFEESIGVSSGYLKRMKKQNSSPAITVIQQAAETYPKYSLDWLISGAGAKYRLGDVREPEVTYRNKPTLDELVDNKIKSHLSEVSESIKEMVLGLIDDEIEKAKGEIKKS